VKQLDGTQIVFQGYKREDSDVNKSFELYGRHIAFNSARRKFIKDTSFVKVTDQNRAKD